MSRFILLHFALLVTIMTVNIAIANGQATDISDSEWIFMSTELPEDVKTYATIGNGHIATVIHRDSVFMNGLYSGERGFSHRARIPSRNNIRLNVTIDEASSSNYTLNVRQGFYSESFTTRNYTVELRTFAHRYYHTVIVTQISIETTEENPGNLTFTINNDAGDDTDTNDIRFDAGTEYEYPESNATLYCGNVTQLEDAIYQDSYPTVCFMTGNLPESDTETTVNGNTTFTYFTSYARTSDIAVLEFEAVRAIVAAENHTDLFDRHAQLWEAIWSDTSIQVTGNLAVSKVINGAFYYLLTSLPITTETNSPVGQFYGLSPGSLAFGAHNESKDNMMERPMDYQGHSFWDTETWMFPPILFFYPDKAQQLLNYRLNNIETARDRAIKSGYRGARFPWESGLTGREVTPDCCEETRDLQIHISADIIFAIRQYIALTRDLDWLKIQKSEYVTNGCGLVREVADFFASRTCYNENGFYDIRGVMPPDEDNYNNTVNNGYTNVMAGYAIFFAKYADCLCAGSMTAIPDQWLEIARALRFLYDDENDYHPEFEGFDLNNAREIKQADVVLLGYPVMYEMNPSTRANDLQIYENLTREDGPAMTWSMHTIGWLDLNNETNAAAMFERSYTRYVREPFKTWTEAIYPNSGAHNFITGMGGFLQSVINGYAGLRLHPEELVVQNPRPLPDSTTFELNGIKYLGNTFDMSITNSTVGLIIRQASTTYFLLAEKDGEVRELIGDGASIDYSHSGEITIRIYTNISTNCELPEDKIGQNRIPESANDSAGIIDIKFSIALSFVLFFSLLALIF